MAKLKTSKNFPDFSVDPVTPSLGAEISGIDLNQVSRQTLTHLRACLLQYKIVCIRGQTFDLDDLCRFSREFGELMQLPYIEPVQGYPEVIRVLKEADEVNMGVFGGDWHSDFSFLEEPPMMSILYANELPPLGGDTLWVNMVQAWKDLPEDFRQQLRGKIAIHTGAPYGISHAPQASTQFKGSIKITRNNPEADEETRHPAVCRHPDTGEEMLFISPTYTTRIDGFSISQSDALLNSLYQHCTRPEFNCRLRWQPGTLVIWDNRNTLHYAVNDYDGFRREMFRTTIKGHAPIPA